MIKWKRNRRIDKKRINESLDSATIYDHEQTKYQLQHIRVQEQMLTFIMNESLLLSVKYSP